MLKTEQVILRVIKQDSEMMTVIKTAMKLELPDSWVSAGFVRSKIWDGQHDTRQRCALPEVDMNYYDPIDSQEETEKVIRRSFVSGCRRKTGHRCGRKYVWRRGLNDRCSDQLITRDSVSRAGVFLVARQGGVLDCGVQYNAKGRESEV